MDVIVVVRWMYGALLFGGGGGNDDGMRVVVSGHGASDCGDNAGDDGMWPTIWYMWPTI